MATEGILLGQTKETDSSFQVGDIITSVTDKGENWHECDGSFLPYRDYPILHNKMSNTFNSTYGCFYFKNLEESLPSDLPNNVTFQNITIQGYDYFLGCLALSVVISVNAGWYYYLYFKLNPSIYEIQDISTYEKILITKVTNFSSSLPIVPYVLKDKPSGNSSTYPEIAFLVPQHESRINYRGSIYIISTQEKDILYQFTTIYSPKTTDSNYYNFSFYFCEYDTTLSKYYCGNTLGEIFVQTSTTRMELCAYTGSQNSIRYFNYFFFNNNKIYNCIYSSGNGVATINQYSISSESLSGTSSNPTILTETRLSSSFGNSKSSFKGSSNRAKNAAIFLDFTSGEYYVVKSNEVETGSVETDNLIGMCQLEKTYFIYNSNDYFYFKDNNKNIIHAIQSFDKNLFSSFPSNITDFVIDKNKNCYFVLNPVFIQIPLLNLEISQFSTNYNSSSSLDLSFLYNKNLLTSNSKSYIKIQ